MLCSKLVSNLPLCGDLNDWVFGGAGTDSTCSSSSSSGLTSDMFAVMSDMFGVRGAATDHDYVTGTLLEKRDALLCSLESLLSLCSRTEFFYK